MRWVEWVQMSGSTGRGPHLRFWLSAPPPRVGIYQKRLLKVDWGQGAEGALATANAELAAKVVRATIDKVTCR